MSEDILSSDQQKDLKSEWDQKTPKEQRQLRAYYYQFKKLPLSEREDLKDKWKNLPPEKRQRIINKAKSLSEKERENAAKKFFSMPNRERLDSLDKE